MRSHVTYTNRDEDCTAIDAFQYRKRYEITCDGLRVGVSRGHIAFQYRKRYEITCDLAWGKDVPKNLRGFQYRKRYEITCDLYSEKADVLKNGVSIPQAV